MSQILPVLHELGDCYGMDTPLDYVSDLWGSEPGHITPFEAIELHRRALWNDDDYRVVRMAHKPGQPVLVDADGNAILVIPEARPIELELCSLCRCHIPSGEGLRIGEDIFCSEACHQEAAENSDV